MMQIPTRRWRSLAAAAPASLLIACQSGVSLAPLRQQVVFSSDPSQIVVTADPQVGGACRSLGRWRFWIRGPEFQANLVRDSRIWAQQRGGNLVVVEGVRTLVPTTRAVWTRIYRC